MKTLKSIAYILAISIFIWICTHGQTGGLGFIITLAFTLKLFLNLLTLHFPSKK